jgi:multidrug efflux pump subunit AcrB
MNLTDFSLRRTRVIGISLLALGIMGMLAFMAMPRNDMPPYTIRFVPIVTEFPGASPTRVESLITDPLEEIVQELPELKNVTSESRTGLSVITVEVRQDVPAEQLQSVWDRLRRKIDGAARTLPEGAGQPEVKDDSLGVVYGIVIGLQNDGFSYDELDNYAELLRNKILEIDDAAEVELAGVQEARVYIDYDPDRLASVGLTATGLQQTIAATNILYPGGSVVLGDERVILEPSGNFGALADLQSALIPLPGGGTIRLDDITTVTRGYLNPPKTLVRINGKPGISMSVAVRKGANLIRLGEKVDALMHREIENLPIGISVFRVASQDEVVEKSISDFLGNLVQAMGVVLGVMLLMLGLRTGLVVASLIPMTMLLTLFLMSALGQGLNQVSLAGLIMALGMLVDNAIVMSEAIVVEMERGVKPSKAAIQASSELAGPLLIPLPSSHCLSWHLCDPRSKPRTARSKKAVSSPQSEAPTIQPWSFAFGIERPW